MFEITPFGLIRILLEGSDIHMSEKFKLILSTIIGIIILVVIITTEVKIKNQKLVDLKAVFMIIAALGFIMCCIGKAVQVNGWTNPIVIVCVFLGAAALLLIILFLTGRIKLDSRIAFRTLYSVVLLKWMLTTIHHIMNLMT